MKPGRREFLRRSAQAAAGAGACAILAAWARGEETAPALPVFDAHLHVWDLSRFRLAWLDHAGPALKRDFSVDDYRRAAAGLNIVQAMYVEVSVAAEQRESEARRAVELCGEPGGPVAGAVIGGVPGTAGFREHVLKFKDIAAVRGVRCSYAGGLGKNKKYLDDLRLLGDLGLCFDLLLDGSLLAEAAEIAAACPRTRFVLDHCGNASPTWFGKEASDGEKRRADSWREGISRLAAHGNAACKISGVAESGPPETATPERMAAVVNHCLDAFGSDRVMFASNWPVCLKSITIAAWLRGVHQLTAGRGEAFQRKLFFDNGTAWYHVKRRG